MTKVLFSRRGLLANAFLTTALVAGCNSSDAGKNTEQPVAANPMTQQLMQSASASSACTTTDYDGCQIRWRQTPKVIWRNGSQVSVWYLDNEEPAQFRGANIVPYDVDPSWSVVGTRDVAPLGPTLGTTWVWRNSATTNVVAWGTTLPSLSGEPLGEPGTLTNAMTGEVSNLVGSNSLAVPAEWIAAGIGEWSSLSGNEGPAWMNTQSGEIRLWGGTATYGIGTTRPVLHQFSSYLLASAPPYDYTSYRLKGVWDFEDQNRTSDLIFFDNASQTVKVWLLDWTYPTVSFSQELTVVDSNDQPQVAPAGWTLVGPVRWAGPNPRTLKDDTAALLWFNPNVSSTESNLVLWHVKVEADGAGQKILRLKEGKYVTYPGGAPVNLGDNASGWVPVGNTH